MVRCVRTYRCHLGLFDVAKAEGTPWTRMWEMRNSCPSTRTCRKTCKNCRPAAFVSAVGQCAEPQQQPGAALRTRLRPSACTSAAFADNGKWRNPQCKKHADRCGRWVNGSITNLQLAGYPALLAACLLSSSIARVQGQNTKMGHGSTCLHMSRNCTVSYDANLQFVQKSGAS